MRSESPIPSDPDAAQSSESAMPSDPIVVRRQAPTRYYAEYVRVDPGKALDHLQAVLDEKEAEEWHLVGVAGGLPNGGMTLFWDTQRPSFGRTKESRSSRGRAGTA